MRRPLILALIVIVVGLAAGWWLNEASREQGDDLQVTDFEECVAAGGPVMESYPRQCRYDDTTFTEEIVPTLSEAEALGIAAQAVACTDVGVLGDRIAYNPNSRTWWIDLDRPAAAEKDGCSPACVVSEDERMAEVNWRCTGLIAPDDAVSDALRAVFAEEHPEYAETLSVDIVKRTGDYVRGEISFEPGAPGGWFFARLVEGTWQVVDEGNGEISCDLEDQGFPADMLTDCSRPPSAS